MENSAQPQNPIVISVETKLDGYRLRNFYLTNSFQGFVWMVFHFSVVFFFAFLLQNVALVGVFLGFANLVSFAVDIPLGIIQRYIPTKRLFIIGAICQLIAVGIFFAFIFKVFSLLQFVSGVVTPESFKSGSSWFFSSGINSIGVIVASVCYGLAKEINDVSTYGYVLSRANPSEYNTILARNNITFGIGSLTGLVVSGFILSFNPAIAVLILGACVIGLLSFMVRFFDNSLESVSLADIDTFRISIQKLNADNIKEYLVETVKKADLAKVLSGAKYLMIKPKEKTESLSIPWKSVAESTKTEFRIIWKILGEAPIQKSLIWTMTLVLTFGFWDTFASSFLLDFLDTVKSGWSYILLAIIGVPGIALQEFAGKIGQKIGMKTIGMIGLGLSGISLILMGVLALGNSISVPLFLLAGLINSLGYACGMSTGQNQFLDVYNRLYAEKQNLKEIDANASSGPMKVLQNLANVIGLVFGGILVGLGFSAFFFIFGLVVLALLGWSWYERKNISL